MLSPSLKHYQLIDLLMLVLFVFFGSFVIARFLLFPNSKRPGPLFHYKSLVNQWKLQHNPYQEKVAFELDNLLGSLSRYEKEMKEFHANLGKWEEDPENTRQKLLIEAAKGKQQEGSISSVKKHRNYFKMWTSR